MVKAPISQCAIRQRIQLQGHTRPGRTRRATQAAQSHCLSSPFLATFSHCGEEGPGRHKHALAPQLDCVKLTLYQMDIIQFPSLLRFVTFRFPWNQISESRKSTHEANNYKITLVSFPGTRKKATQSRPSSDTHPSPQQKQEDIGQPGLQGRATQTSTSTHSVTLCH